MAKAKSPKKPTPRQRARAKASTTSTRTAPAPAPSPAPPPSLPPSPAPAPTALQPRDPSPLDRPAAPTGSRLSRGQKTTIVVVALSAVGLAVFTLWPRKANAATNPQASTGGATPNASAAPARPRTNTTPTATVLSDGLPPPDHDSQLDSDNGTRTTLDASERGLTRTQVLHYQQELFALGASTDAVDGILGQRTRAAVRSFQNAWNARNPTRRLRVDGILGPQTRAAIDEAHTRFRDGTPADANTPGAIAIIEGNP